MVSEKEANGFGTHGPNQTYYLVSSFDLRCGERGWGRCECWSVSHALAPRCRLSFILDSCSLKREVEDKDVV